LADSKKEAEKEEQQGEHGAKSQGSGNRGMKSVVQMTPRGNPAKSNSTRFSYFQRASGGSIRIGKDEP